MAKVDALTTKLCALESARANEGGSVSQHATLRSGESRQMMEKLEKLDSWLADLGEANLKIEGSLTQ
eukprot:219081-Amphidinium_carterae.1